ncbi:hypothetical protein M514_15958 [Trichuris suis]|uniref:Uncharacterized protein n=1 Tax=Trichuris suis TaxID=68888 RepID=A0A085NQV2_9BILA|nr:hypothetical protein M514_15958 [Trichuris suis]
MKPRFSKAECHVCCIASKKILDVAKQKYGDNVTKNMEKIGIWIKYGYAMDTSKMGTYYVENATPVTAPSNFVVFLSYE